VAPVPGRAAPPTAAAHRCYLSFGPRPQGNAWHGARVSFQRAGASRAEHRKGLQRWQGPLRPFAAERDGRPSARSHSMP
jgi:hypothetical protein